MIKPNQKNLYLGAAGLILIILAFVYVNTSYKNSLSIITPPIKFTTSNGQSYYTTTVSIDRNESYTVYFNSPSQTLANGSTLVPQQNFTVSMTPWGNICLYQLRKNTWPTVFGYNFNLVTYYDIGNPERKTPVYVQSSNSDAKSFFGKGILIDATDSGSSQTLASLDGKGILTVTALYSVPGKLGCPSPSGLVALNSGGSPKIVSALDWQNARDAAIRDAPIRCATSCLIPGTSSCSACISGLVGTIVNGSGVPTAFNFQNQFNSLDFSDKNSIDKTEIDGVSAIGSSNFGVPVVTLTADAAYVNAIYYNKPQITTPQIVDLSCQQVSASTTTTMRAVITNTGDTGDTYRYTIKVDKGSITPSSDTVSVAPGEIKTIDYVYTTPSVTSDGQYNVNYQLCSSSQFGSNCVTKSCSNTIKYVPQGGSPPPGTLYCGDNICSPQIGETAQSCPMDCKASNTPPVCDPTSQTLVNNECICKTGYKQSYNSNNGQLMCTAPFDLFQWISDNVLLLGAVVVIVTLLYVIVTSRGGRRR